MNTFANAVVNAATITRTENGSPTYSTSLNECVDLFFQIGAMRAASDDRIQAVFAAAYAVDPDIATRIALYGRDVRGGQGERKVFRAIIRWLEIYDTARLMRILHLIPVVGRWDDLFEVISLNQTAAAVFSFYSDALRSGNALAAKWAPREKRDPQLAARLRGFMGLDRGTYRRMISALSNTVEQQMCARQWDEIVYSHVPSVASARYSKTFGRHDNSRYVEYLNAVRAGKVDPQTGKVAKINTGAVYPYDVVKTSVDDLTADTMWTNLPDYVPQGSSFLPVVDVSASMGSKVGGTTTCLDVSISLGIYLAERNKSAFNNLILTFNTTPWFFKIPEGTIRSKYRALHKSDGAMHGSTDLDKAMQLILDVAVRNRVPQSDIPSTLIILSDMEFNGAGTKTVAQRTRDAFTAAGYEMPQIVWWNIQSRSDSNVPVRANEHGMALVSGFSPTIVKSLLGGQLSPIGVMMEAVNIDKYAH